MCNRPYSEEQFVDKSYQRDNPLLLLFFELNCFGSGFFINQPGTSFMNTYMLEGSGWVVELVYVAAKPYRDKEYPED
ncbi:hypothetical protein [Chitinophaga sp. Cy-1792]|uniref:hypothetical protein n=1 Tax=Chitinophaga sp. Cy-1792 TaxID=2608339 RepID=UPI001421F0C9|nr:hypothetical protein [Chitinophaga sp. Cy-1792]NIG52522.1 hypothetical protein [Chitinophaga sp. Cy-1792]